MIGYLDSGLFYLTFLLLVVVLCVLNIAILVGRKKNGKIRKLIPFNKYFLLICIVIFVLDSIPYLFIDIFVIPVVNTILSNVFLLLIGISSVMYEYMDISDKMNVKNGVK